MKKIQIDEKTLIIDGLSQLLILKNAPSPLPDGDWVTCGIRLFKTKKGRDALEIDFNGSREVVRIYSGSGDRSWAGWDHRRPVNAIFAEAVATSNGGGCWFEVIVMRKGVDPLSAEIAEYREELE